MKPITIQEAEALGAVRIEEKLCKDGKIWVEVFCKWDNSVFLREEKTDQEPFNGIEVLLNKTSFVVSTIFL